MTKQDLFKQDDFRQQYALAKEQGDKRFGSPCEHKETSGGVCRNCLRKVVVRDNIGYQPRNSNYHDHRCTCPGCNYDGPEPTDGEVAEWELQQAWNELQAVPSYVERRQV